MEMFISQDKKNFVDYEVFERHIEFKVFELETDSTEGASRGFYTLFGTVKWDGCSNWDCTPNGALLHFCDVSDIKSMHDVMVECCEIASKILKKK